MITLSKEKYRKICEKEPVPIFSQYWWLDIVAGGKSWNAVVIEESGNFLAALPFVQRSFGPIRLMRMPELTPWLHIWFNYPAKAKYNTRLSFEKEMLTSMIPFLPKVSRFHQKYSYSLQNWLPWYWLGYKQTTRYSYRIEDLSDLTAVYNDFKKNNRYDIKKVADEVSVIETDNVGEFLNINKMSFERQEKGASFSNVLVAQLDAACSEKRCRKILFAKDTDDRIHAAVYLVWDQSTVYYLMGGGNSELRNSNANSLLIWESIKFAASIGRQFDFEGSMIEPVERFFRSFGAKQVPYFSIFKNKAPFTLLELVR